MRVEMLSGESAMLSQMEERREPAPQSTALHKEVRRRLLLTSDAQPLTRRELAIISAVASWMPVAAERQIEEPEPPRKVAVTEQEPETLTPLENAPQSMWDAAAVRYSGRGNGEHSYDGPRMEWNDGGFKSVPGDKPSKWEKGRPLTYISEKDGAARGGTFYQLNKTDKTRVNIKSSEFKKVFSVPVSMVTLNDLSRPSAMPLAQQI